MACYTNTARQGVRFMLVLRLFERPVGVLGASVRQRDDASMWFPVRGDVFLHPVFFFFFFFWGRGPGGGEGPVRLLCSWQMVLHICRRVSRLLDAGGVFEHWVGISVERFRVSFRLFRFGGGF